MMTLNLTPSAPVLKDTLVAGSATLRIPLQPTLGLGKANSGSSMPPQTVQLSKIELERLLSEAKMAGRRSAQQEAEAAAKLVIDAELKKRVEHLAKEQADKLRGLAKALADQAAALRANVENEITEAAFVAVCRLLGERAAEPRAIRSLVAHVIHEARLKEPLTVLLHPDDWAATRATVADTDTDTGDQVDAEAWPADIRLVADRRVALGGCLIETTHQTLDARLEVQLELLRRELNAVRAKRRSERG